MAPLSLVQPTAVPSERPPEAERRLLRPAPRSALPQVQDELLRRRMIEGVLALVSLSRREREVLHLVAQGWSNQGIGDHLHLAPKTVETHLRNLFAKLGLAEHPKLQRRVIATRIALLEDTHDGR